MRCLQTPDIPALVQRFSQDDGPVTFSIDSVKKQFQFITKTPQLTWNLCGGDIVVSLTPGAHAKQGFSWVVCLLLNISLLECFFVSQTILAIPVNGQ